MNIEIKQTSLPTQSKLVIELFKLRHFFLQTFTFPDCKNDFLGLALLLERIVTKDLPMMERTLGESFALGFLS